MAGNDKSQVDWLIQMNIELIDLLLAANVDPVYLSTLDESSAADFEALKAGFERLRDGKDPDGG